MQQQVQPFQLQGFVLHRFEKSFLQISNLSRMFQEPENDIILWNSDIQSLLVVNVQSFGLNQVLV